MNDSQVINYQWAPLSTEFFFASMQISIFLPFFLSPNFYFLYLACTNETIKERTLLRNAMILFPCLILTTGFVTLTIQALYLSTYFSGSLMNVELCSGLRTFQAFLRALVASAPFIFSIFRYMRVFHRNRFDFLLVLIITFFLNGITLVSVIVNFFNQKFGMVLKDEICTYIRIFKTSALATSVEVLAFSVPLCCPVFGIIVNILFLYRLNKQISPSGAVNNAKKINRSVAINLICNSIEPFLAQVPSTCYYLLTEQNTKSSFIVWRLIDGMTCFSYAFGTIASIIFIEDIRIIFLSHQRVILQFIANLFKKK